MHELEHQHLQRVSWCECRDTLWFDWRDEQLYYVVCRFFERVRDYFTKHGDTIPMSFVLGFYVTLVVKRWWEQYRLLPWPDTLALFVSAAIPGVVSPRIPFPSPLYGGGSSPYHGIDGSPYFIRATLELILFCLSGSKMVFKHRTFHKSGFYYLTNLLNSNRVYGLQTKWLSFFTLYCPFMWGSGWEGSTEHV